MCFFACGGDDDNDGPREGHDSRLVGTWYDTRESSVQSGFIFERNGTCYYSEWRERESPDWGSAREWETDNNYKIAIGKFGDMPNIKIYRYEVNGKNLNIYDEYKRGSGEYTHLEWQLVKQ